MEQSTTSGHFTLCKSRVKEVRKVRLQWGEERKGEEAQRICYWEEENNRNIKRYEDAMSGVHM